MQSVSRSGDFTRHFFLGREIFVKKREQTRTRTGGEPQKSTTGIVCILSHYRGDRKCLLKTGDNNLECQSRDEILATYYAQLHWIKSISKGYTLGNLNMETKQIKISKNLTAQESRLQCAAAPIIDYQLCKRAKLRSRINRFIIT